MKRCPQCTKTYDDEMDFCFDDGTPLRDLEADIPTVAFTAPISMPTAPANRRAQNKFMLVALGALAALVIVLGVLVYSMYVSKDDSQNNAKADVNVEPKRESTPKTVANTTSSDSNVSASNTAATLTVSAEHAEAVFGKWIAAQNSRDRAAYRSCYSTTMIGVKRVPGGGRREYKYDGWMADRLASMKRIVSVSAENRRTTIEGDQAVLRFTQFWRSVNHCDVGDKELRIKMFADGAKIVFETLENPKGC